MSKYVSKWLLGRRELGLLGHMEAQRHGARAAAHDASARRRAGVRRTVDRMDEFPGGGAAASPGFRATRAVGRAPGCGFTRTTATTEAIACHFCLYWLDIQAGPFDCAEECEAVYLAAPDAEVAWLGDGATVVRVSRWISRGLIERGFGEPVPLTRLAGMYWVCGFGGWCATAELEDRLRRDPASVNITHGPFDREEDAQYAYDLLWESPE